MIEKVRTLEEAVRIVQTRRAQGQTIVFANGVFDVLHVGHIRYLREARALGDRLIVAVNDDASTRAYKGAGRPRTPLAERLEILDALECVDDLVPFGEPTVDGLLRVLQPEVHAKGTDYTAQTVPERETVRAYGGRVAICGDEKTHSSTALIEELEKDNG